MEKRNCRYGSSLLNYAVAGKGPCLVLLPGFCENSSVWNYLRPFLTPRFRLLLPDLPGFGDSPLPPQTELTIELMAEAVNSMLEAESITECVMIGHSMGGYVTLAFAELFSEKLKGFGLFHSSALPDDTEKKKNRGKAIRFIEENGMQLYARATASGLFSTGIRNELRFRELYEMMANCSPQSAVAATNAMMMRPDRSDQLKNARNPVLFIAGRNDHLLPMEKLLSQAIMPASSSIHILHHSAHMGMLEETERTADIISEFMDFA
jgi:pimeloyl-ACP methyl ester carboxylesterase